MADVWDFGPDDPIDNSVLLRLANHCNDFGRQCFPSIEEVAAKVRRSVRTVSRSIAQLEADDWISVERGVGKGKTSHYTINVAKLKTRQAVAFSEMETRQPRQQNLTATTAKPDSHDNPPHPLLGVTVRETSRNQSTPQPPASQGVNGNLESTRSLDRAVDQVCSALGLTKRRDRRGLRAVIELEAEKGEPPPTVALAMIAAYRKQDQARLRGELARSYGVMNFFERGVWKNEGRWHWDEKLLRQRSEAGVGSR